MDQFRSASILLHVDDDIAASGRVLRRLARSAIPALADFCLIYYAAGSRIVCVASAHATREGSRALHALARAYRVRRGDRGSTIAAAIRTARPVLRADIPLEPRATVTDAVAALHRRLAPRSAIAAPIVAGNKVLGAVTLCYSRSGRTYVAADIPAARRLAARIARALAAAGRADATLRLHAATGHARQGTTVRRRVAPRD
jgi:GAF domain-containing protein